MKIIGIVSALGICLAGSSTRGENAAVPSNDLFAAVDQPRTPNSLDQSMLGGKPGQGQESPGKGNRPNRPDHPDKPEKEKPSDAVKTMLDDIKSSQTKFLDDQKDLQRKLKDATKAQREKIRNEMREKREQFLEQQKEMRQDFRRRVQELKDQLKDHSDVIDNVKEEAKDKARQRKGGED